MTIVESISSEKAKALSDEELLTRFSDAIDALRNAIFEKRTWDEYQAAIELRNALCDEITRRMKR